jgi:hypothetical protein
MSSVVIAGDTSGSVTLSAPAVAGSTTLTLPTTNGTLLTTSMVLLGTITTTSGSSVSLSGLTLTNYKQIQLQVNNVTMATSGNLRLNNFGMNNATTSPIYGAVIIDLTTSYFTSMAGPTGGASFYVNNSGLTTSSTSITLTSSTTFSAGSILVYGVA